MTSRPRLSDRVVFTVDASRADFWRGEVFDTWDGQSSWTRSDKGPPTRLQRDGNTYYLQPDPYDVGAVHGASMRQTFHIETGFSEVLFAAPSAVSVESDRIILGHADGTAAVLGEFGKDAVYTVVSKSSLPTADDLRAAGQHEVPRTIARQYAAPPETSTDASAPSPSRSPRTHPPPTTRSAPSSNGCRRIPGTRCRRRSRRAAPTSSTTSSSVAPRLVRAGVEQHGSARAQRRHPGPPRDRIRAGRAGRPLGSFRRAGARRARLDRDLLPRGRVAGVRPDRVGAARRRRAARGFVDGRSARRTWCSSRSSLGLLVWLAISAPNLVARFRRRFHRRTSWASGAARPARTCGCGARVALGHRRRRRASTRDALAARLEDPRLDTVGDVIDRDEFAAAGADPAARAAADAVLDELLAAHHGRQTFTAGRA